MIPSLNVDTDLVTVPQEGDTWAVEWLGDSAGLLEGSSRPGEGISFIAAHNTLNDTTYGPFALLSTLEINDLIAVNGRDGSMKRFRVYANELMIPEDMERLITIAGKEDNSLALVTCENESIEGRYLNRRVIFAKPVL